MKTRIALSALIFAALSINASAERNSYIDEARVTDVKPVYRTIEHRVPHEECWVETVRQERPRYQRSGSATPTIVGGIIGGAIGNAVGAGSENKKVGAVVGSILGMSIGHDIGQQNRRVSHHDVNYQDVERCEVRHTTETEQELTGYDVTYIYNGQTYYTRTDRHPGKNMKVAVNVQPVRY